jgi:adenylate cyclase class IV
LGTKLRNVEIKARVEDIVSLAARAARIASAGPTEILQDDTFFPCTAGRLKLRDFLDGTGELIFYRRADRTGPKESFYVRSPTTSPDSLRDSLTLAYGQLGRVKKRRTLFLLGRTRLHLDDVAALGTFLELEVVLRDEESSEAGVREATGLMNMLNIGTQQLIDCAYIDLLAGRQPQNAQS